MKNLNGPHSGMGPVLPGDKLGKAGAIVTKFDCAGNLLWSHLIGLKQSHSSYGNYYLFDALGDEGGNTYIFGYADSQDFLDTIWYGNQVLAFPNSTWINGCKTTLLKIDPNGNIVWAKDFLKDYKVDASSTSWAIFSNKSFNSWREASWSDRYSIGKEAHCMTMLNDTLTMILNMDSSTFIPNSVYYMLHDKYPLGTYGAKLLQFDAQTGTRIDYKDFLPKKYYGDTLSTYWPFYLYIASLSPLGHGQYSMIASIWPQGTFPANADSLLPTPFLDQIISCQAPYYFRGSSVYCVFRRYFSFTFTKDKLLSFNYIGDSVAVVDANTHPNIPRQELFVVGARNTTILSSNQKINSKNLFYEAEAQSWLNQTDQSGLPITRVSESEAILLLGKDNQLKRIIQPDSSKNDFIFGVSGTKHPIAAVYNSVATGTPVSSAPTLPNETWIDGYHLMSNQQYGMAGAMQFDGTTGHIINQNYSNKPLNINALSVGVNYAENIYQSEKGNIYYYGHLVGPAALGANWYPQHIAIPGDDTTFGQSILSYFEDRDAVLVKFGNSCGAADTVTVAPLEPSWLSATCTDESGIQLHWEDNSHYELGFKIYRAVNKGSYSLLCTLPPNSNGYTDHLVVPASTYHYKVYSYNRIDTSFAVTVSKTLCYADGTENVNPLSTNGKIYPNPSEAKQFTLLYNATQNSTATLSVMSLNGALLYQSRVDIQSNTNSFEVVLPSYTPAGTYLVSLKGAQVLFQDKLVLVK